MGQYVQRNRGGAFDEYDGNSGGADGLHRDADAGWAERGNLSNEVRYGDRRAQRCETGGGDDRSFVCSGPSDAEVAVCRGGDGAGEGASVSRGGGRRVDAAE